MKARKRKKKNIEDLMISIMIGVVLIIVTFTINNHSTLPFETNNDSSVYYQVITVDNQVYENVKRFEMFGKNEIKLILSDIQSIVIPVNDIEIIKQNKVK